MARRYDQYDVVIVGQRKNIRRTRRAGPRYVRRPATHQPEDEWPNNS